MKKLPLLGERGETGGRGGGGVGDSSLHIDKM